MGRGPLIVPDRRHIRVTRNPYESPACIQSSSRLEAATLSVRRLLADGVAGALVGATYASLGVALLTTARMALIMPDSPFSHVEQLLFAFVAGAFLGASLGTMLGGFLGGLLGGTFRWLRLAGSLPFFWTAVLSASLVGALIGLGGGYLLAVPRTAASGNPMALIGCPLGAVLGGMLGALAGRKWVQIVGGPAMALPWGNPLPGRD